MADIECSKWSGFYNVPEGRWDTNHPKWEKYYGGKSTNVNSPDYDPKYSDETGASWLRRFKQRIK